MASIINNCCFGYKMLDENSYIIHLLCIYSMQIKYQKHTKIFSAFLSKLKKKKMRLMQDGAPSLILYSLIYNFWPCKNNIYFRPLLHIVINYFSISNYPIICVLLIDLTQKCILKYETLFIQNLFENLRQFKSKIKLN